VDEVGAGADARERVRHREPEVVVGVHAHRSVPGGARDALPDRLGAGVADGVCEAEPVGAGLAGGLGEPFEEAEVGARAVLADDLDPEPVIGRVLHELPGRGQHGLARRADLPLDVAVAGGDDDVDAVDAAVECEFDVPLDATAEARDRRVQAEFGDPLDCPAFASARARAAGFDDGDASRVEFAGDCGFLIAGQRHAGGLLAVPERGVEK